ncbi:MAG: cytochrome c biogenesis protein CcsA [Gemmatimonadota bacterium]
MRSPGGGGGRWPAAFGWAAFAAWIGAAAFGLLGSPPERGMGHLQKIMYVHLPVVWMAFLAYFAVFIASGLHLWRGGERSDLFAASAAEVGTVLTGLTLAIGSIWARPTWGIWWTWDPRLTTTAILFLIFVGYLTLRSFVDDAERRGRWSAVVGILGFLNVPVVYMSVRWWRTIHQTQSSPETVDAVFVAALRVNAIAFLFVAGYLVYRRYRTAVVEREAERVEEAAALGEGRVHA